MTTASRETRPASSALPKGYASYACRLGSHTDCTEAARRPVRTPGVTYQQCRCACHGRR